MLTSPLVKCLAGKFRALVCADGLGVAPKPGRLIKHPCDVMPRDTEVDCQIDGFLTEIIDAGQHLDSSATGQGITDKIH